MSTESSRHLSGERRSGTIVCSVTDNDETEAVVDVAVELSERLDLRLVLVAVGDGILDSAGRPLESVTTNAAREGARKTLQRVLFRTGPPADVECRLEMGDPTVELARVAHEEHADLVLIGSPRSRLLRGRVRIAGLDELRMACPCPVVVVPSRPG
ncbi:MAG: universal stress protein [Gaiellales bacterium]